MLKSLYIKNYALIDSLEIDFESGFSVITGETGAGKSIILGALSLILGQRADAKSIKQGESKCVIEGYFDISDYNLTEFFENLEIDYEPTCLLRRELLSSGKSRAFVNDTPVTLSDLKELGSQLIDIHSQHQNLLLGDTRFQMQIVDTLAGNKKLLKEYQATFFDYKKAQKALDDLRNLSKRGKEEEDYLRFQYESLKTVALKSGEQEELEEELETLNHSEEIKIALYKIHSLLTDDEHGIVTALKDSLNTSQSLVDIYPKSEDIVQRIENSYIDLKDLGTEVERMGENIEFDPERLSLIQTRLDTIYTLQKRHSVDTIAQLIAIYEDLEHKIENIDSYDEQLEAIEKDLLLKTEKMLVLAKQLTDSRKVITGKFEKELVEKVAYLGMPNVQFKCEIIAEEQPNLYGMDDLLFLFSANKNVPLQPVAEIASGGEISRLMLCLKSMIAGAKALPTIIFDEIDTGVSGEIADKMGIIMKDMGTKMQVIAITHLPQIAARGKTHYHVYKSDSDDMTTTNLSRLSDKERLEEIARMLSGTTMTEAAIQNAKVLLGF